MPKESPEFKFSNFLIRNPRDLTNLPDGRFRVVIDMRNVGEKTWMPAPYFVNPKDSAPVAQWLYGLIRDGKIGKAI